ncbi:MAG: SpaH/EbpB family LPXTG-anchored major pilin, partial [Promicromonosporaceae bacterium]|nr:SpaH/EbpB family LPXTG-anchored major pilin [Promicromonosporaceae bacterium]
GEAIEWIIRADVPALPGETIEMFRIVDVLDERLLWMPELFIPGELQVWLEQPGGGAHSSIEASLFTVTHTDATSEGLGGTLTIDFTAAGRAFLDAQPVGVRIVVVIRTTLVEVGDGVITNQARLYPNSRAYADSRPVLSNTPESRFGGIQALKVDNTNHDNVLAGAVFQVFASEADARAGVNALSIGEVDTWTTDADGLLTINGLRLSNWANGQAVTEADEGWNTYWLVEVQAPQGFELLAEPIPFHVLTTGAPTTITLTVENIPTNAGFRLPLTGGTGTTILTVGGLALAGAAVALKAAHSRRARNQAA